MTQEQSFNIDDENNNSLMASTDLDDMFDKIDQLKNGAALEDLVEMPNASNEKVLASDQSPIEEIEESADMSVDQMQPEVNEELATKESEPEKDRKTDKYRKLQNDKYRAIAEKAAADERIRQLEKLLDESIESGGYHYGRSVYSDLEKAEENKRRALEEGDTKAFLEADKAFIKAVNNVNELERWTADKKKPYAPANIEPPVHYNNEQVKQAIVSDWLDNHDYLQPSSRNYNPTMANEVATFANYLDDNLSKRNQMDIHYTPEYFEMIDNYIDSLKRPGKKVANTINSLPQVGSVRNSYQASDNPGVKKATSNQIRLSSEEKEFCSLMDISEAEYIESQMKLKQQKLQQKLLEER